MERLYEETVDLLLDARMRTAELENTTHETAARQLYRTITDQLRIVDQNCTETVILLHQEATARSQSVRMKVDRLKADSQNVLHTVSMMFARLRANWQAARNREELLQQRFLPRESNRLATGVLHELQVNRLASSSWEAISSASASRFQGIRVGSLKNKHDVVRYNLPGSRQCYIYIYANRCGKYEIFMCRECWRMGLRNTIKVDGNKFLWNPSGGHICTTINVHEDRVARSTHKRCVLIREDKNYSKLSNSEILEDMLESVQREAATVEEREEMTARFHGRSLNSKIRNISRNKNFHRQRDVTWESVPERFANLEDGTPFLQLKAPNVQLYFSRTPIEKVHRAGLHTLIADGVHNVLPMHLGDQAQLYTIHGVTGAGHEVPIVHALTTRKTESTYELIFRRLWQELTALGSNYDGNLRLVIDFEKAAINAARRAMPGIDIEGCAFHLAQTWNRKRDKLGLRRYLVGRHKDNAVVNWRRTIKGLPFLPVHLRRRVPGIHRPTLPTSHEAYAKCEEFLTYLQTRWLTGPFENLWCKWGMREFRTTNAAEAYHSKLRRVLKARNVGLDVLIGRVAADTRAQAQLCMLERVPDTERDLRRRDRERRRRIDEEMQRFADVLLSPCPRTVHIIMYCKKMSRFVSEKTI